MYTAEKDRGRSEDRQLVGLDRTDRLRTRLSAGLGVGENLLDELLGEAGRRLAA